MIDPARAASLQAARLRTLTRDRVGPDAVPSAFPGGAALVDGPRGWALLAGEASTSLGGALAWARRVGAARLDVLADAGAAAGLVARRAAFFAPAPGVWSVDGSTTSPAAPDPATVPLPPPDAPELRMMFAEAGLEVVEEDGMTLGEMLGLEVARIVHGSDGPELAVGVGRFDREITEMTHAHLAPADRVARVTEIVAGYRRPEAPPHPLNQMVPERWLRAALVTDPARVGASALHPVPSVRGRRNLLETGIASAVGTDTDGRPLVVTCSTGVDLDLVPAAADDRAAHAPGARLVLVVPARDALALTRDLAARLADPAEVIGLDGEWRIPWT
ncbi:hypothetical protein [Iamia sp.]|uniref:hypothetical protein n=1 Tax=Iamia sp. TaxID=2722710 RepID=UPI002BEB2821|nr:hypothetical protein [Iamia sp.]HXH58007.1 hypothetical protein [Iamia sp.]